jgi:phage shock protein B
MNPFTFLIQMMPFIIPIAIVGIIFGSITTIVKARAEAKAKGGNGLSEEETRIMRELHQSLNKMEKRVEALETIIINKK